MLKLPGLTLVALLLAPAVAGSQPACLPKSVFAKNEAGQYPYFKLGAINDVLTMCAYQSHNAEERLGCWTVNPANGVLGPSAVTVIPGQGQWIVLDSKICFDGYCVAGAAEAGEPAIFAASTDGLHAAIISRNVLHIFATSTKAKAGEIELIRPGSADWTKDVSNGPWDLIYNGDTLFVIGSDAGPSMGVWVFKENGDRAGVLVSPQKSDVRLEVYRGGFGILGRDKVAFADTALQNMIVVTGANAAVQVTKRTVSYAPCRADQFEEWATGDDSRLGAACKRVIAAKYAPYTDMSLAQLPSGDFIATLSGPAQGALAVLNPAGLTERRRLNLAKCR